MINTDKAPSYEELKEEEIYPSNLEHRQVKYLNNLIEADHGQLKRLIKPTLGFKSMKTAYASLKGFEVMRRFKKGQMNLWKYGYVLKGEICLINQQLESLQLN